MFTIRKSGTSVMLAALWLCASGLLAAQTFTTLYKFGSGDFLRDDPSWGTNGYHACGGTCGTMFQPICRSGPFVETEPASGNVGRPSTF